MTYGARRTGLTNQTKAWARRRCGTLWKVRAHSEAGLEEAPKGLVPICLHNLEHLRYILDGALFDHGVGNLEERSDVRAILQVLRVAVPNQCSLYT